MKAFFRWFRCWLGFHDIDRSDRGYVGFYYCKRCDKYIRQ